MKRSLLLIFILVIASQLQAQNEEDPPFKYERDFKVILERTKNSSDDFYYDKLLQKYLANDSTLTNFGMLALLIGFTDKPAYKPYKDVITEDALYKLNEERKYSEALTAANAFLYSHPFSVRALMEKSFSHTQLDQPDSAAFYTNQLNKVLAVTLASGYGNSIESPYFVLGPKDGELFWKIMRVPVANVRSGYDKNNNFLDIVNVKLEFNATKPYYFIIQHAKGKMYEGFSKEEIKKMQKEKKK